MKSKLAILLALTVVGLQATAMPHESGGKVASTAIEIRYISIGTGIDSDFKNAINQLLVFRKISQKISYIKESSWGHEGESTVCIQFSAFTEAYKTMSEIEELKKTVSNKYTQTRMVGTCDASAAVAVVRLAPSLTVDLDASNN